MSRWPFALALALVGALLVPAPGSASGGVRTTAAVAPQPSRIWSAGEHAPERGLVGPWQRELERRRALLRTAGRGPEAVLALLGLLPQLEGEVDAAELVALVDSVRNDGRRHPLVRSYAGYLRGRLLESAGAIAAARERYAAEGYLLDWRVVGPFDNTAHVGETTRFGPEERAYDPLQTFQGKVPSEELPWRPYDETNTLRGAYVSFDEFLRPNVHVVAYATTWVKVERATPAVLHFGTGGAHQVWVNGERVGTGDAYRGPDPLQDAYAVRLAAGWNRVLVKLAVEEGMWGFYARLSAPGGEPLATARIRSMPDLAEVGERGLAPPSAGAPVPAKASAARSLRGLLEARAQRSRARAQDALDLAEFYRWVRPFAEDDASAALAGRKADQLAGSARSAWVLALLETTDNASRDALVRGIARARDEGDAQLLSDMLLELAWRYRALGLERRARETIDEAQAAGRDNVFVELARVDQLADDGFPQAALAWLDDLLGRYPRSSMIRRSKASRLLEAGRTREALAVLDEVMRDQAGDGSLLGQRIEAHMQLGEVDLAVGLAALAVATSPGLPAAHRQLARLLEAQGELAGAAGELAEALALSPLDPEVHAEMGRLRGRAGDRDGSIVALQRSLELEPQQPELRDLLASLDASGGDDLYARHGRDLAEVAGESEVAPASWAGKDAAILHQLLAVKISKSGLGERMDQRIIRILDERGTRTQAIQGYAYDPEESYVEVRAARVLRADGTIEENGQTQVLSLADAGYRMYYDQRQVQVQFPGLRVGDTLEVAFVRRDVTSRNKFDDYFGDLVPLESTEPIRHLEYRLEVPSAMQLHFDERTRSRVRREVGKASTVYHVEVNDTAGLRPEANMPGWTEVADHLHVSTYATWDEVGKWYWGFVEEQLQVDDDIRAGIREALSSLPPGADERARVAAIYQHVIRRTRYVGLEFGVHGYKPYRTTDVYARKFGDCKDKASLLKVMLGEIGVESYLVLVRTRDQGALAAMPASLSAFNHAIVYVPKYDLFLDGTAEFSGVDELPAGDQGASVLIVRDGAGGEFRRIPFSRAADNLKTVEQRVRLGSDGAARVEHDMRLTGSGASAWRVGFQSPETRAQRLTEVFGENFPGTEVESVAVPTVDQVLAPFELRAVLTVPAWAQAGRDAEGGATLRFKVAGYASNLTQRLAPQVKREHPLVLTTPSREVQTIRYQLPRGMKMTHLPSARRIESPHGVFSIEIDSHAGGATVTTTLELTTTRIDVADYRGFRDFLREVDESLGQAFEAEVTR